jgi:hypothetical protein
MWAALAFLGLLKTIRESQKPKVVPSPQIISFTITIFSHVVVILGDFSEDFAREKGFASLGGLAGRRHDRKLKRIATGCLSGVLCILPDGYSFSY